MKHFIKLFFAVLLFFVPLNSAVPVNATLSSQNVCETVSSNAEVFAAPSNNEKYIVSVNNTSSEIFTQQNKNSDFGFSLDKLSIQNKLQGILFCSKSNKININNINELSATFANEICTRAP